MEKKWLSIAACAVLVVTGLTGCGDDDDNNSAGVTEVTPAVTDAEKRQIRSADTMIINGETFSGLSYHTLFRTGDTNGEETFGLIKDINGDPITFEDSSTYNCFGTMDDGSSGPDHTTLLNTSFGLFTITHFECSAGGAYITQLTQNASTGELTPKEGTMKWVDMSDVRGTNVGCAGMATPWNSHLGSEEYEVDMDLVENGVSSDTYDDPRLKMMSYYMGGDADNRLANGYDYGWTPEIQVINSAGDTQVYKHYSMGRFAHELSYVMPDSKTVYLSDDGTNVGLFMFIADTAEDLSAGTLYAAKWTQTASTNGGSANLSWINLGHATNTEISAYLTGANALTFSDIFEKEAANEAGTVGSGTGVCSDGYTSTNAYNAGHECLKLKTGMEKAASRLETRRYAAMLGATTEFRKEEGITFDPDHNKLYVVMSRIQYGMEDNMKKGEANTKYDQGGNNDIKVPYNNCGGVYALDLTSNVSDTDGASISSSYVVGNMYGILMGTMKSYEEGSDYYGNQCDVNGLAEPDNATYLPGSNILVIGEDSGYHPNDMIWAYNVETKELTRIITALYGSETTSPFWYSDINGFGYLTAVFQHPYGEDNQDKVQNAQEDVQSYVGYYGPFKNLAGALQ